MINFRTEIDTRSLTVKQEDDLIYSLEEIPCNADDLSDGYNGEFTVDAVQLPDCVNWDDENQVYGKIIVKGVVDEEVLEDIYEVIESAGISYVDNDPFGVKRDRAIIALMKETLC